MKTKECKSGISMIKPTSFYSSESEKTKLNWFCYELSMSIYDDMREDIGKQSCSKGYEVIKEHGA